MKRLLAYLFIVLGFGLTFNVSANAKEQKIPISYCEGRLYYGENCIYYYYKKFAFGETKLKSTILKSQPIRANIKKLCLNYSRLKASSLKTSSIIANEYRAIYKRHPKRGSARIPGDLTYPISLNPNTKDLLFQTNGECINVDRPNDKFINLTIQSSSSKPYNGWAIIKEPSQTQIAKKEKGKLFKREMGVDIPYMRESTVTLKYKRGSIKFYERLKLGNGKSCTVIELKENGKSKNKRYRCEWSQSDVNFKITNRIGKGNERVFTGKFNPWWNGKTVKSIEKGKFISSNSSASGSLYGSIEFDSNEIAKTKPKKEPTETQPDNDLEEEKKKMAEEKRKIEEEKRKKAAAKKKKEEEEQKRIAEAKKKEEEEQKYRILVKKYGDDCKDNSLGSPEFNKCLKDVEAEDLLQAKLQREFLASLTPEEARAYTCNNTFGFRKGSNNFKDCIFKLYTTELELEKLDLEKQLALAKVEAEKAKADTARAQVEIIQARSAAARAEGKLQEAQIQATKAQTLSMQQQAAASRQQAAAAQAQARAAQQQNSLNLMTQGLKMLSGNQSSSSRLRTNCSWSSIGISCR